MLNIFNINYEKFETIFKEIFMIYETRKASVIF